MKSGVKAVELKKDPDAKLQRRNMQNAAPRVFCGTGQPTETSFTAFVAEASEGVEGDEYCDCSERKPQLTEAE